VVNYEPGTVIHMDSNRQFLAGPVGTGTAAFIQVEQAILRGCGARWRFPEYFSGDASNNNMASSIVAGSPFVVAVEGNQLEWGVFERAVAKKVLELCVESGRLSREQVASVDVKVTPPAVALANREEEERLREMRNKAGVLSVTTWQQQVGLDPKHEDANFEAEARRRGAEESGEKTVGESEENCECDEEISEGMLKGKRFTGEIRDSLGRRRCYHKGKQIPCDKLGQISAGVGEPGEGEPQAKKDTKDEGGVTIDGKKLTIENINKDIIPTLAKNKHFPTAKTFEQLKSKMIPAQFEALVKDTMTQMALNQQGRPMNFQTNEAFVDNAIFRAWTAFFAVSLLTRDIQFSQGADAMGIPNIASFPGSTQWKTKVFTIEGKKVNGIVPTGKPSDALQEFFSEKSKNATLDCATYAVLAHDMAMLQTIGAEAFNEKYKDKELNLCGLYVDLGFTRITREGKSIIGDIVGFEYPEDALKKLSKEQLNNVLNSGWLSENSIYIGHYVGLKDRALYYVAFPSKDLLTADKILEAQRKATKGAPGNVQVAQPVVLFPGNFP
jgi:hypothetical protein